MDKYYMKRALKLAEKGKGFVDPNPLVGAVIVKDQKIIGEGYHAMYGEAHAEVNAFQNAYESPNGATMYVTLEPCSHYGNTPPCADLIVKHSISRVVIASLDPNPLVAGKGIEILKNAGIETEVGILDDENQQLNRVFFKYIQTNLPFVAMKTAMTADGKIASYTYDSKWITNSLSRQWVHQLRASLKGIMVGVNTVIHDDPSLNVRLETPNTRQPIRIILDTRLDIPLNAEVIQTARQQPTIIVTTSKASSDKLESLKKTGVTLLTASIKDGEVDLLDALKKLASMKINSILLEGGSAVNFSAMQAGVIDEIYSFIAPKILGGSNALSPVGGKGIAALKDAFQLKLQAINRFDDDICLTYTINKEDE